MTRGVVYRPLRVAAMPTKGWPRGSVLGGWDGAARGGSAGVALAVGRGPAARLSEENRCESQQRNPYRLRSPQEASLCQVDRCFIRREGASQSKLRLYVVFFCLKSTGRLLQSSLTHVNNDW